MPFVDINYDLAASNISKKEAKADKPLMMKYQNTKGISPKRTEKEYVTEKKKYHKTIETSPKRANKHKQNKTKSKKADM